MSNSTNRGAQAVHGSNPQFLVEKVIRARIYDSLYWKEHCFALNAESLIDQAIACNAIGGVYDRQTPTPFMCLTLKLLQLQPEKEILFEYLLAEEFKYLRALAAFYIRLTFRSLEVYEILEPLMKDYRKLRVRQVGGYSLTHFDEFIDDLLTQERVCDIILPRLTQRSVLEETEGLPPRKSLLDDDTAPRGRSLPLPRLQLTTMAALARALPTPLHNPVPEYEDVAPASLPAAPTAHIPKYGSRKGWKPKSAADFGAGGAYPECHVAQYPLDMGRKKTGAGTTLALQVDQDGTVRYDAIAQHGRADGSRVQSSFKDLVPLHNRTDMTDEDRAMERPDAEQVNDTAERTRLALERITQGKIKAAQPKHVPKNNNESEYIRYTPANQSADEGKQRIIKMTTVQEDPLEPPRFKHKKIPRGPAEPPPPVMHSPPRAATAQDQKDWMIPPCISNWKNNKGYTIPLDKRLAADGRGLQDIHINDNFAKFSEALYVADRHAREEVRARAQMQQLLAQKEKTQKEENLRLLAQRAREERAGITPSVAASSSAPPRETGMGLGGYGSDSEEESDEEQESEEDEEAIREREQVRAEKRREREKELRMSNMGSEMRAKLLAREQNRDISEKIALGIAKPSNSKETLLDSRLFNREALSTGFGADDSYNLYDKPLFHGSSAAAAIYKSRGNQGGNDEAFGGGTEDGIREEMSKDRFQLGNATRGFEGADSGEVRDGPVQFEKDQVISLDGTADPFGVEQFMNAAKKGGKRTAADDRESRKRARGEEDD